MVKRVCTVDGCGRAHEARGLCKKHYNEWRRALGLKPGDPRHGTVTGYVNNGCRCSACNEAHTLDIRKRRGLRSREEWHAELRARPIKHGTLHAYRKRRCRCEDCKQAEALHRRRMRRNSGMREVPGRQKYREAS